MSYIINEKAPVGLVRDSETSRTFVCSSNISVGGDRAGRGAGGGALGGAAALVAVAGGGRGLPRAPHLRRQPPPQGPGGHRRREGAQVSVCRAAGAHVASLENVEQ